ncbi:hypothetical protein PT974_10553 [Cladobotryum mycophilum]|uniref:Stress activated map kinase interacting n=1 Tax=Cladobotryum mycophilum TaxID=491253 RepID=A0ABR0SB61_9HYPO
MGLVDYSESESESEAPATTTAKVPQPNGKKPAFQKVVDRSNPGKIIVNLPQATATASTTSDEPPTKRSRTGGGGGLFSGFNSFLPAPKNIGKPGVIKSSSSQARPGIHLKTSAEVGFSRDGEKSSGFGNTETTSGDMGLPPPKRAAEPSIPDELKPASEVKLVGKPLMFKPLSVARNNAKKKTPKTGGVKAPSAATANKQTPSQATNLAAKEEATPAPPPKKTSLFSLHVEEPSLASSSKENEAYEPLFETGASADQYPTDIDYSQAAYTQATGVGTESLDTVADDLNLSAAARRELFGRGGNQTAKKVINFNMDQEYRHNEEIRAAGEQQTHNPVRSIQSGKHSLRQLVHNVVNQRDALEESFAKGKTNRKEASSRYGW